ncbi:FLYWCH zinc finger domain-containing protein [Phthorimaea operculella]|nr:FLYWCH zinc finger domain-containing protein [Phthorimaea operculella]
MKSVYVAERQSVIPPYEFAESKYGNCMILMQGYRFTVKKHNANSDRYTWRCATHHRKGCRASIFSLGDNVVRTLHKHTHSPPPKMKSKKENYEAKSII